MAGHSQFKNIMYRKGAQDAKKARVFAKLAREITVAAKLGGSDPEHNPRLRAAIIAARAESMPKDNIDKKALELSKKHKVFGHRPPAFLLADCKLLDEAK